MPPVRKHGKKTGRVSMGKYDSKWKRKREAILARDGYQSQIAKRFGRMVQADTVHHILPVEFFPEYRLTSWNLISITAAEHNRLHERETHELTDEGMALALRTARAHGLDPEAVRKRMERSE